MFIYKFNTIFNHRYDLHFTVSGSIRMSAIYYFLCAIIILLLAFDSFFILELCVSLLTITNSFVYKHITSISTHSLAHSISAFLTIFTNTGILQSFCETSTGYQIW